MSSEIVFYVLIQNVLPSDGYFFFSKKEKKQTTKRMANYTAVYNANS